MTRPAHALERIRGGGGERGGRRATPIRTVRRTDGRRAARHRRRTPSCSYLEVPVRQDLYASLGSTAARSSGTEEPLCVNSSKPSSAIRKRSNLELRGGRGSARSRAAWSIEGWCLCSSRSTDGHAQPPCLFDQDVRDGRSRALVKFHQQCALPVLHLPVKQPHHCNFASKNMSYKDCSFFFFFLLAEMELGGVGARVEGDGRWGGAGGVEGGWGGGGAGGGGWGGGGLGGEGGSRDGGRDMPGGGGGGGGGGRG